MGNIDGEHGARRSNASRTSTTRRVGSSAHSPKRAEPTEPEVPSAKRVHALHRQRSTLIAAAAVTGLFVLVLVLLYKTGRQVTALPSGSKPAMVNAASPRADAPSSSTAASTVTAVPAPRPKASEQSPAVYRKPAL